MDDLRDLPRTPGLALDHDVIPNLTERQGCVWERLSKLAADEVKIWSNDDVESDRLAIRRLDREIG